MFWPAHKIRHLAQNHPRSQTREHLTTISGSSVEYTHCTLCSIPLCANSNNKKDCTAQVNASSKICTERIKHKCINITCTTHVGHVKFLTNLDIPTQSNFVVFALYEVDFISPVVLRITSNFGSYWGSVMVSKNMSLQLLDRLTLTETLSPLSSWTLVPHAATSNIYPPSGVVSPSRFESDRGPIRALNR